MFILSVHCLYLYILYGIFFIPNFWANHQTREDQIDICSSKWFLKLVQLALSFFCKFITKKSYERSSSYMCPRRSRLAICWQCGWSGPGWQQRPKVSDNFRLLWGDLLTSPPVIIIFGELFWPTIGVVWYSKYQFFPNVL